MASYYAQIDVNISESTGAIVKKTTPKKSIKTKTITPKKPKDNKTDYTGVATKMSTSVLAVSAYANSVIGSYTGNKHTQSNINATLSLAGIGIGILRNPTLGTIALTGMAVKQATQAIINQTNANQESEYRRSYLGNMTTSGSRWRGGN